MAISFREFPWYIQAILFVLLALIVIVAGEYLPFSPVYKAKNDLAERQGEANRLRTEVTELSVYQRRSTEFRAEMDALQKQLDTLKMIVPEEKEVDEFIRLMHQAAVASNVEIRRLTAQSVVSKEYHFELPFEVQVDGPYYAIQDFFARLAGLSRIINVQNIAFTGLAEAKGKKYPTRPDTTVTGTFTATTFFGRTGGDAPVELPPGTPPGKGKQPGKPTAAPPKQPAKS